MLDEMAREECAKYEAVWQHKEYRKVSPGMLECERAFNLCGMKAGDTLIDYGAGPCRASLWFQNRGLDVLAIDIADNARETHEVQFLKACLWDLPEQVPASDFAFCTDVMEHIIPEKVDDVMVSMADRTKKAAYFRIATRPDKMGPLLLGKPLHLTVKGGEWWREEVGKSFAHVEVVENTGRDVMLLARP